METKLLKKEFIGKGEVRGFKFNQIKKGEYAYVYRVELSGDDNFGISVVYEVFRRKIVNPDQSPYHDVPAEIYPKAYAFGLWAWTYATEERALAKFEEINKPHKKDKLI